MNVTLPLLVVVGLMAVASIQAEDVEAKDKQKFLFEIVYRVEDPLMFEEYIKLGKRFVYHTDDYLEHDMYAGLMDNYYTAYKYGDTLAKGEFFGAMVSDHYAQLTGLFGFLYYAKSWEIFQRNVCWARLHANEAMFVQALNMAVIHRPDMTGFLLPAIYEIFPHYFFNSKFIYEAEKFDYDVWSKYTNNEKAGKDAMPIKQFESDINLYTKDWKKWQWWKMMDFGEQWHLKENSNGEVLKNVQIFWMPVDYTRDIDFYNRESALSYFTEDVGWNAYWYYFNMRYAPLLDGKTFGLTKDRRGEYWFYVLRQMLSRYYMERLSHGYGDIPHLAHDSQLEYGYNPQLVHYNGIGYSYRKNYYDFESYGNLEQYNKVRSFRNRIDDIISKGYYTMADGQTIDLRQPQSIEFIGNVMQGNVDVYDQYFSTYWFQLLHMYLSDGDHESYNYPHVFVNYETMLRDPVFYMVYKRILKVFYEFHHHTKPYTNEELLLPGVTIKDVKISELLTYFDVVYLDVSNLLNDKMTFVDGEFVWDKALLARQLRLNHSPFNYQLTIESDKEQKVAVRVFLAPKYNEYGRLISLSENRENFYEIDKYVTNLKRGNNSIYNNSWYLFGTAIDRTTYTELYHQLMTEGNNFDSSIVGQYCSFPHRLLLPRGWVKGMPMQMFFVVSPFTGTEGQGENMSSGSYCNIRSGYHLVDDMPLGYPFDREINEYEFIVPNMYFKDVKIYHKESPHISE